MITNKELTWDNKKINYDDLIRKIRNNPNSPKIKAWRDQARNLKTELAKGRTSLVKLEKPQPTPPTPEYNFERNQDEEESPEKRKIMDSTAASVCPDRYQHNLCDGATQPMNLLRSVMEYVVTVNFDGSTHSGAFSIATQPSIGSLTNASQQTIGIVDTSSGWPTDFTSPSSYVSSNVNQNPKVDFNILRLITPQPSMFSVARNFTNYVTSGTSWDGFMFGPNAGTTAVNSSELRTLNVVHEPFPDGTYNASFGSVTVQNATSFSFAGGTYNINSFVFTRPGPASLTDDYVLLAFDRQYKYLGFARWDANGVPSSDGYFIGKVETVLSRETVAPSSSQEIGFSTSANYVHDSDILLVPTNRFSAGVTLPSLTSLFQITPVLDGRLPSVSNNGMIATLRPIAHSALLTNLLPEILAGGNIVSYSAPSGDIRSLYYQQNGVVQAQEWYQLATLNKGNLMHDGPVKDGTYVFTQPWSEADLLLRTPADANQYSYPGIIISGAVIPPNGYSGNISAFRLRVVTLWEYVTDSNIFTPKPCLGSASLLGDVMNLLTKMQHALPNNKHRKYLQRAFNEISKHKHKSKENWLTDALNGVSSLLTTFL